MHLAVASLKGGVGKTTTAIHLAAYFQQDKPTLLIDADRNRSALVWAKEDKLPFMVASQAGAVAIIARYTHVIIDMRGGPEEEEFVDLAKSNDLMIIPTTPNHLDLDATIKAVEILRKHQVSVNKYKVLLTKVDYRTVSSKTARYFLEENKIPLFKTEIPLLVAFERAAQHGKTVKDYSDEGAKKGWQKYAQLGKEILGKRGNS
ncbi:MAG: ParA family protein [Geminocystis sp.]|nr:ParA family protein [Geminocystis sp.]HIK37206.1 ParA family protein [Geminocystis sp. M7585_C2015_104]MCS7147121.1 ParA family protein [Geminocystis sp.]MCX8079130.1 ParA family protein [Geminocystis sp.]MDW8116757.1 ParA family protein [Geminocystis sp.]